MSSSTEVNPSVDGVLSAKTDNLQHTHQPDSVLPSENQCLSTAASVGPGTSGVLSTPKIGSNSSHQSPTALHFDDRSLSTLSPLVPYPSSPSDSISSAHLESLPVLTASQSHTGALPLSGSSNNFTQGYTLADASPRLHFSYNVEPSVIPDHSQSDGFLASSSCGGLSLDTHQDVLSSNSKDASPLLKRKNSSSNKSDSDVISSPSPSKHGRHLGDSDDPGPLHSSAVPNSIIINAPASVSAGIPPSDRPTDRHIPVAVQCSPDIHDDFDQFDLDLPDNLDDVPGLEVPSPSAAQSTPNSHKSNRVAPSQKLPAVSRRSDYCRSLIEAAIREKASVSPVVAPRHVRSVPSLSHGPIRGTPVLAPTSAVAPIDNNGLFNDGHLGSDGCLQAHLMDDRLKASYKTIKNLRSPAIFPVGNENPPCEDSDWVPFADIFDCAPKDVQRALLNSILFKSRGGWFNPARTDPSLIKANSAHIPSTISPVQNTAFPALCLMVGILHRCSIVQPSVIQLGNGQTRIVRDIHVKSFQQEAQRTFAFFAHVFNFNTVSVVAAAGVVTYSSMQLFENQRKANPDDFSFKPATRALRPGLFEENDHRLKLFPHFRLPTPFTNQGKRSSQLAFESNINQLHEIGINSYPLYENGDVDLPEGSLVTVGYTAHTYTTKNHYRNITTGLSFDLAFVVLMALPPLAQIPRPVRTTFTYPFDEDYAYSTPRRNASALPASPFQFMSPATSPMHTPRRHNQRSLVSASSFDANMHLLSDRQLPPATSSPLPLSHDDLSTSPYPLIHSARPRPVAGTAQEAELEAELDFDDVLSLVHPSNY